MGYSIRIGNGDMVPVEGDEYTTQYSRIVGDKIQYFDVEVKEVRHIDAPVFPNDEATGNSNGRYPYYTVWGDFCEVTGLFDFFFHKEHGLMRESGFQQITQKQAQLIELALKQWQEDYPNARPGFECDKEDAEPEVGYDPILARLIWLDWWVKWAIEHCENAGIYNNY